MPVLSRWLPLIAASFLLIPPVFAESYDSFTVKNIAEEVKDENPVQGRNRALLLAQRDAYQMMMQRITAQSDWSRLPKLNDEVLEDLVQDVGIDQERVAPGRIIATLSVHFKPEAIRKLLRGNGIAYAEWRGRPLVMVPLWQAEQGVVYAEAANPWRDLWKAGSVQGLVPISVAQPHELPEGVAPSALAAPSEDVLTALSQRHGNADVLVVLASAAKTESGQIRLDLTLSGAGPLAGRLSGQKGYGSEPNETLEQLMQKAAQELTRSVDEGWKSANLLQYDKQGQLVVMAPLANLNDWLTIRDKLARATAVRSYDIAAMSKSEAALVLHYVGEQGQLESVLMQNGLVLTWEQEHWALRNTGARVR